MDYTRVARHTNTARRSSLSHRMGEGRGGLGHLPFAIGYSPKALLPSEGAERVSGRPSVFHPRASSVIGGSYLRQSFRQSSRKPGCSRGRRSLGMSALLLDQPEERGGIRHGLRVAARAERAGNILPVRWRQRGGALEALVGGAAPRQRDVRPVAAGT